jgi:hypothetical protein
MISRTRGRMPHGDGPFDRLMSLKFHKKRRGMTAAQRLGQQGPSVLSTRSKGDQTMKNSFIRALTLGIAIAFPATVLAQAAAGDAPAAEKKETKKAKKEKKADEGAPAAGDTGAAGGDKTEKTTKKSKKSKADKAAGGDAGKTTP